MTEKREEGLGKERGRGQKKVSYFRNSEKERRDRRRKKDHKGDRSETK